jgi:formimidoylglutamate deiminase
MAVLYTSAARLPDGWARNVRFEIGSDGALRSITANAASDGAQLLPGPVIPGMPNLHSHAFQRSMAGLAEARSPAGDDFWSWREAMYRFLAWLGPAEVEAIATQLYIEMAKAGYTRVCEFHYLHNDPSGVLYRDSCTIARAHLRAAEKAGIGITLVSTLYTSGGCGGKPLKPAQSRFAIAPEALIEMVYALEEETVSKPDANIAIGIHSLRAARIDEMERLLVTLPGRAIHIHVAEQRGEVEECLASCGRTPVAQLDHAIGLDARWSLVHATHITPDEIEMIVEAGATVVLCPSTEGNLGDGFFPADAYFQRGGKFGIGTDSQVSIDPREELRWFEYGRRLQSQRRALSNDPANANTGAWLWLNAADGGRAPCAAPVGRLEVGARADFLVLDAQSPALFDREGDTLLDAFVFASTPASPIREVWVGGKRIIDGGRHAMEDDAARDYRAALMREKEQT